MPLFPDEADAPLIVNADAAQHINPRPLRLPLPEEER
jgi:hypothetical protein